MSKINSKDYVVLDVETNGLSSLKHDLLSISIYIIGYCNDHNKIQIRIIIFFIIQIQKINSYILRI